MFIIQLKRSINNLLRQPRRRRRKFWYITSFLLFFISKNYLKTVQNSKIFPPPAESFNIYIIYIIIKSNLKISSNCPELYIYQIIYILRNPCTGFYYQIRTRGAGEAAIQCRNDRKIQIPRTHNSKYCECSVERRSRRSYQMSGVKIRSIPGSFSD